MDIIYSKCYNGVIMVGGFADAWHGLWRLPVATILWKLPTGPGVLFGRVAGAGTASYYLPARVSLEGAEVRPGLRRGPAQCLAALAKSQLGRREG